MTAREEFNAMLNACSNPRAIYNALLAFASTPNIKKTDNMYKKRAIIISEINAFVNETSIDQNVKQVV